MKAIRILPAVLLVIVAISCKKDDPTPQTPSQLLSSKTWILTSLTSTDASFQSSGQILVGSDWLFKADKTFSLHHNVSGVDFTFTGTWFLGPDNKSLLVTSNIGGSPATSNMEIVSISTTALMLKETASGMVNTYSLTAKP